MRTEKFPQSIYHRVKHTQVRNLVNSLILQSAILDAGCGIGNITGCFVQNHKVFGIDNQITALHHCRKNFQGTYLNADLFEIPFIDNCFDLVLLLDAIEHFNKPITALHELARVLKSGGHILICTINYSNPLWYILENTWHRFFAGNCRTFSKDVHPTRYSAFLLREHCKGIFHEIYLQRRILKMELFFLGKK